MNVTQTCRLRMHYGEPCDCEARLAKVVTHTCTSTGGHGPDFCAECSEAISEWVPWPCEGFTAQEQMQSAENGAAIAEHLRDHLTDWVGGQIETEFKAAFGAIYALHAPTEHYRQPRPDICKTCRTTYPFATVTAIEAAVETSSLPPAAPEDQS